MPALTSDPCLPPVCPPDLGLLVCVLNQMLRSSPSELLSIHERQHCSRLRQEVDRVRRKLEETLIWSQQEKVRRRSPKLGKDLQKVFLDSCRGVEEERRSSLVNVPDALRASDHGLVSVLVLLDLRAPFIPEHLVTDWSS